MHNPKPLLPPHRLKIVLIEPEIPQNTGNIARLCAVTGSELHLVRPLGFILSHKHLKRSGMDYWDQIKLVVHDDFTAWQNAVGQNRYWLASSKATQNLWDISFAPEDWLVLGRETAGLDPAWLAREPQKALRIPQAERARCLNIANAAGIVLYEALRQLHHTPKERGEP